MYYCVRDKPTVKSQWIFATNIFLLNNSEGPGQGFSNTDDLPHQMFSSLKSRKMRAGTSAWEQADL